MASRICGRRINVFKTLYIYYFFTCKPTPRIARVTIRATAVLGPEVGDVAPWCVIDIDGVGYCAKNEKTRTGESGAFDGTALVAEPFDRLCLRLGIEPTYQLD